MTLLEAEYVDLPTESGPMRAHLFRPTGPGRWPGVLLFSEIFQVTGPIRRLASALAGEGFAVAVPEIYHDFLPVGTVLAYDQTGSDRGNELKYTKEVASHDADARALCEFLARQSYCTGALGTLGVCLGGHLALRAALRPEVRAAACFYATDVHSSSLGAGRHDDTLARSSEITGDLLFVWGRQDPHVPREGRRLIYERLADTERRFEWHEFNAAHAFLRDEGPRYNPALARIALALTKELFDRALGDRHE